MACSQTSGMTNNFRGGLAQKIFMDARKSDIRAENDLE